MIVFANFGLMSKNSPSSVISRITSYMSYGWRFDSGTISSSFSDWRSSGSFVSTHRRLLLAVRREVGEVVLDGLDALLVVLHLEVADARLAAVDLGAAELLHRDVLAGDGLGQVGAGERHRALADDHRHEVREARDVGGARGAGAHHRRDHRDHARHHDLLLEQVAGAGEHRPGGLLDAGAGGVEQPDEGHALVQRHLAQAADLELAGHAHRAGHHGEVVGGDAAGLAVDVAPAGDDAVGGRLLALHRPLRGSAAGPWIPISTKVPSSHEQVDALARGQLAALVLLGDLLLAAAELRLLAARVEVLGLVLEASSSLPVRIALLEERLDALLDVLGREGQREL